MLATERNISDVAWARIKAIRTRARELGDVDSDDERLVGIVERRANHYATRSHHPAGTAQVAVAWAIADMHTVNVPVIERDDERDEWIAEALNERREVR